MSPDQVQSALADITAESDPTLKHLKLASLVSAVYPRRDESAEACARKLIAVALSGQVEVDWQEVHRLAERPEYRIVSALETIVSIVAIEIGKTSPYHSQRPPD